MAHSGHGLTLYFHIRSLQSAHIVVHAEMNAPVFRPTMCNEKTHLFCDVVCRIKFRGPGC